MVARTLMVACAGILLTLGVLHLVFTLFGSKLAPRDPSLRDSMAQSSLIITDETTMWSVWIGVNATHSMALILFALIYGYLSVANHELLFGSPFLLVLGLLFVGAFAVLGRLYFFSLPFWSLIVALSMYIFSISASRA